MMRVRLWRIVVSVLVGCALCAADGAAAQERAPAAAPQQGASAQTPPRDEAQSAPATNVEDADLAITARVTAGELLFRKVPNPRVEFTGRPRRETVWEAERHNLPQEVRPGVTYRDIGITLRITSVFADIDRIVAEALGEIPPSDDAPQAEPPSRDTPTEPAAAPPDAAPPLASSAPTPAPKTRGPKPRRGRGR